MRFPYLLNRMKRRRKMCFFVFLIALVTSLVLCSMSIGESSMSAKIEEVYDRTTVTCAVTNLTGTQSDNLALPKWVIDLFMESEDRVHIPETPFSDYITDVEVKATLKGKRNGVSVSVVGITSFAADHTFRVEESEVEWLAGDESVFRGEEAVCVVSDDIYESLPKGDSSVTVQVYGDYNSEVTADQTMEVVGVCTGKTNTVYCPWEIIYNLSPIVNGSINADSIGATLKDSRKIDEFKEKCSSNYFVDVDPRGIPRKWEASPIYENYPYALEIYDETLSQTVSSLQQNQRIFKICRIIITVLTMGFGFVIGNLSTKQRQNEIALQYILGLSVPRIFIEAWLEHVAVSVVGFVVIILPALIISPSAMPWGNLLIAFVANSAGAAIAVFQVLHKRNALQLMIRE